MYDTLIHRICATRVSRADERPWGLIKCKNVFCECISHVFTWKIIISASSLLSHFCSLNNFVRNLVAHMRSVQLIKLINSNKFLWRPFCRSTRAVVQHMYSSCIIRIERIYSHTHNHLIRWTVRSYNVIVFVCILRQTFVSVPHFSYELYIYTSKYALYCHYYIYMWAKSWKLWSWHERTQTQFVAK